MREDADKPKVLAIGDIMQDIQYWVEAYPENGGDEKILAEAKNAGGSAANTAVALCSLGMPCAFHGRVGNDELGKQLADQMRHLGVDLSCLEVCGSTGYTITMIDPGGERTMFSYRAIGDYVPTITPAVEAMLNTVDVVFVSGYHLAVENQAAFVTEVAKAAQAAGCLVMLDAAPIVGTVPTAVLDGFLAHTDVLLPNRDELLTLAGCEDLENAIEATLKRVPCLVVKLGAKGSRLVARPGAKMPGGARFAAAMDCTAPTGQVEVVDTTGAGDSFNAGFIAAFLQGEPPESWPAAGNRQAAKAIASRGAISCYIN